MIPTSATAPEAAGDHPALLTGLVVADSAPDSDAHLPVPCHLAGSPRTPAPVMRALAAAAFRSGGCPNTGSDSAGNTDE